MILKCKDAEEAEVEFVNVDVVCTDQAEHRTRIEQSLGELVSKLEMYR